MRQITDSVFRLGTRGHNFYLIRDGDEVTMVDAGCSGEWDRLQRGLSELGLGVDAVSGVVCTHVHSDHFGLATKAAANDISVAVHEDDEPRAVGQYRGRFSASSKDLPVFRIHTLRTFLPMLRAGVMKLEFLDSVGTFTDGETLDLPGHPRAVHTPGHTEGHVMFHIPNDGLLFTGDGLVTMSMTKSKTGPQMIGPVFDVDHEQAVASLDRIVDIDASLLLPGHGKPFHGAPREAVALATAT